MQALYAAKRLIEDRLCEELNLTLVQVPLIVDAASGVNDYLDRDGSRTPVAFHISNDRDLHPIDAEVVQAATKWKRMALAPVRDGPGRGPAHRHARRAQGLLPRPRPLRLRRPVGLGARDHRRGAHARLPDRDGARDLEGAEGGRARSCGSAARRSPTRATRRSPTSSTFLHAEDILAAYPDLPRKQRETQILQEHPGDLHLRDRLAARGRLPARAARRRLRRLVDRDASRPTGGRCTG